jgi:hypothetical protein
MKRWGRAVLAQLLGWLGALWLLEAGAPALASGLTLALLAGALAAVLSLALREPRWRAPMQTAFSLAVGVASGGLVPSWIWALALALSLLVFGGGLTGRRAPLYLTQSRALAGILACLPEDLDGACLDVGAGVGSFILRIAPERPRLTLSGIERSPLVCLLGDLRCRLAGAGRVHFGDLWRTSLADFAVVYAFLSPEAMEGLWHKACTEMPGGGLLVVNAFPIPGIAAERTERYGAGISECVYRYRVPSKLSSSPR